MSEAAAPLSNGHVPVAGLRLLGDDRLARRVAAGDQQALAVVYQRHHQGLFRYCRAILGNSEDAADALQSTMVAALRTLPGEKRDIRLKPWLYRIAHNESVSLLRRRAPHAGLEQATNVAAPRGADVATRERLRELVTDLRELQDRQRAALVMRELSGLDYGEIGAALDASPGATKQLVFEARAALHEMAEGRDMSCDSVRRVLSEDDRRKLRGRKVRAHMKACVGCRDFHNMMSARRRDLAMIAPPLPAAAAAAVLGGLLGGGHGGGTGFLAGLVSGGASKVVAASTAAKGVAAVAAVATVGAGTAGLTGNLPEIGGHEASRDARHSTVVAPPDDTVRAGRARGTKPRDSNPGAEHRRKARKSRPGLPHSANGREAPLPRRPAARAHPSRPAAAQRPPSPRPPARPAPNGARSGAAPPEPTYTVPRPENPPVPPVRAPDATGPRETP